MRFGQALELAHIGKRIARHGWNGKGMYVYLTRGTSVPVYVWAPRMPSQKVTEDEKKFGFVVIESHLDMMTAQGHRVIGWLASQTDVLADDWYVVDGEDE